MEENKINELRHEAENFASHVRHQNRAGMHFVSVRTAQAMAAVDYIAHLEQRERDMSFNVQNLMPQQTSRAQRTTEWESAAPVGREFAAAGQAGLAKAAQAIYDSHKAACLTDPMLSLKEMARDNEEVLVDAKLVLDLYNALAAPAAATEQATDDDLTDVLHPPRAALKAEDWDATTRKPKVKPAAPLATPADAGAGLNERALLASVQSTERYHQIAGRVRSAAENKFHDVFQIEMAELIEYVGHIARMSTPGAPVTAEPAAYLHQVVCGDGEPDQALSFAPDNFPLAGTLGYRSLSHQPLYTAPAPADRDAILEDAALQCEAEKVHVQKWHPSSDGDEAYNAGCDDCANAIRALKSSATTSEEAAPAPQVVVNGQIARRESIAANHDAMIILTQSYPREAVIRVVDAHTERNVAAALAAAQAPQQQQEPIYQIEGGEFGDLWEDTDKDGYRAAKIEGINTRIVYATPSPAKVDLSGLMRFDVDGRGEMRARATGDYYKVSDVQALIGTSTSSEDAGGAA